MKLYRYCLRLLPHGKIREGILVQLGSNCWGEVAPLPGWSSETLEQAYEQLRSLKSLPPEKLAERVDNSDLFPSVSFGLESALRNFSKSPPQQIASLLMGSREEILQKADLSKKEGFRSAKVKVSHLAPQEALELLKILSPQFHLRVDVNRAWDLKTSVALFSHFSQDAFDYIEEPVNDPEDLHLFTHPFALDETLRETPLDPFLSLPHLKALVYKPTLMGGPSANAHLFRAHKPIVLSSSFESGVGICHLASLATAPFVPPGLDTYRFLERDLLAVPPQIGSGTITLPDQLLPMIEGLDEV